MAQAMSIAQESRPARGVWIETLKANQDVQAVDRHAPRGACGLKLHQRSDHRRGEMSRPARGVWIETR